MTMIKAASIQIITKPHKHVTLSYAATAFICFIIFMLHIHNNRACPLGPHSMNVFLTTSLVICNAIEHLLVVLLD